MNPTTASIGLLGSKPSRDRRRQRRVSLWALLVLLATTSLTAQSKEPAGLWKGAIETPAGQLEVSVTLTRGPSGAWAGAIDIPAQGVRAFELSGVAVEGDRIHFEMSGVPGQPTFEGAALGVRRHPRRRVSAGPPDAALLAGTDGWRSRGAGHRPSRRSRPPSGCPAKGRRESGSGLSTSARRSFASPCTSRRKAMAA